MTQLEKDLDELFLKKLSTPSGTALVAKYAHEYVRTMKNANREITSKMKHNIQTIIETGVRYGVPKVWSDEPAEVSLTRIMVYLGS